MSKPWPTVRLAEQRRVVARIEELTRHSRENCEGDLRSENRHLTPALSPFEAERERHPHPPSKENFNMGMLTGTRHGDSANELFAYYQDKALELEEAGQ